MADGSIIQVKDLAAGYAGAVILQDINFGIVFANLVKMSS